MGRIRILPYKQGSRSAKALATKLGAKVLRLENSKFKPKPGDTVINWGNTHTGQQIWASLYPNTTVLNSYNYIQRASNKLTFFNKMAGNAWLPKFWTNKDDINDEDFPIVCRTVLSGHSGIGIHIAATRSDLVDAPLYVKYLKKKDEYRVHCARSSDETVRIIAIQRKAKRIGAENVNWQVRNHTNGFVYVRNDVNPPPCVQKDASEAFLASSLDFGAVDVIYNEHQDRAYVLEINTAPGLEGQTITDYAEYFKEMIDG